MCRGSSPSENYNSCTLVTKSSNTHSGRQETKKEGNFTVNPWKHDHMSSGRNPSLGNLHQDTESLEILESQSNPRRKIRKVPFGSKIPLQQQAILPKCQEQSVAYNTTNSIHQQGFWDLLPQDTPPVPEGNSSRGLWEQEPDFPTSDFW